MTRELTIYREECDRRALWSFACSSMALDFSLRELLRSSALLAASLRECGPPRGIELVRRSPLETDLADNLAQLNRLIDRVL